MNPGRKELMPGRGRRRTDRRKGYERDRNLKTMGRREPADRVLRRGRRLHGERNPGFPERGRAV